MPNYYAEFETDRLVRENFYPDWSHQGVFVEVGAASPDYLSMSQHFRESGWRVIAIEPNPYFCAKHRERGYEILEYACGDRDEDDVPFETVLLSENNTYLDGKVTYESFSALKVKADYAALRPEITPTTIHVKLRKLDTILAEHAPDVDHIDVLSVDVEGWELDVIRGLSIARFQPDIVIIENYFEEEAYVTCMVELGYALWRTVHPNQIFTRASACPTQCLSASTETPRRRSPGVRGGVQTAVETRHG
jgi:FkbM family methyltransferase